MKTFSIGDYEIGSGVPFIIAEVAQAHDGNLNFAHSFIDAVADTGVEAVKFQMHLAEEESTLDEPFRVKFSHVDETRYDYWKRVSFSFEEWQGIYKHCADRKIICLNTPLSVKAVEWMDRLGTLAYKVGSGEVETPDIFEAIAKTKKPILLSSGMSSYKMVERAVNWMSGKRLDFALFQCTTKYPTPLEEIGLNVMHEFKERFNCPVGLSDHSANLNVPLLAMAQGADLLEMHVTFSPKAFGPDAIGSLTLDQFSELVKIRKQWQSILNSPVDKDKVAENMGAMLQKFSKSVALRQDFSAGTVLTRDMLTFKKPGTGIPPSEVDDLVGLTLSKDAKADRLLQWEQIKEEHERKKA